MRPAASSCPDKLLQVLTRTISVGSPRGITALVREEDYDSLQREAYVKKIGTPKRSVVSRILPRGL